MFKKVLAYLLLTSSMSFSCYAENKKPEDPKKNTVNSKILPLRGKLNTNQVFNSNSPEIVKTEGILLSTFPSEGKKNPFAHLNQKITGEFDIFTHHISVERDNGNLSTLHEGIIINNPNNVPVRIKILSSASYLSQPDSPFIKLDDLVDNSEGKFFAGPGDRVSQDIIRVNNFFKEKIIKIEPNETILLKDLEIPIKNLIPPYINGRTTLIKLKTSAPIYIADLALFEKKSFWFEQKITLNDWLNILNNGDFSEKRDKVPSPLNTTLPKGSPFIYGRVSGVAQGNEWSGKLTTDLKKLVLPENDSGVSFVLNTVYNNTYGTKQVQSGDMKNRYSDTAYQSHANYGVTYFLEIPLYNNSKNKKKVSLSFDSPIRIPENKSATTLTFLENPPEKINFRGEIEAQYEENGKEVDRFFHIVERFGQKGKKFLELDLEPNQNRMVKLKYIYPADSTPPHVITIYTEK